jgi:hypothetical protein
MEMSVKFNAIVPSSPEKITILSSCREWNPDSSGVQPALSRYTELLLRPANVTYGFMETGISLFNPDVFTGDDNFAVTLVTDGASPDICREDRREEIDLLPLAVLVNATIFKTMLSSTTRNLGCVEREVSIWRLSKDAATK